MSRLRATNTGLRSVIRPGVILFGCVVAGWLSSRHGVAFAGLLFLLIVATFFLESLTLIIIAILGGFPFAAVAVGGSGYNIPFLAILIPFAAAFLGAYRLVGDSGVSFRNSHPLSLLALSCLLIGGTVAWLFTRGANGQPDTTEFLKWSCLASVAVFPLALGPRWTRLALRVFALTTAFGAAFALIAALHPASLSLLGHIGYLRSPTDVTYVVTNSTTTAIRAAGSYVDPNIAGLFFILGLTATFFEPNPTIRHSSRVILTLGIIFTLSREAYIGALFAGCAFAAPSIEARRIRTRAVALIAGLVTVLLLDPATHSRIVGSLSSQDIGSRQRAEALGTFTSTMKGHWLFGYGFGRPEFRESAAAYTVNVVANSPLASIYRGGLVAGLGFLVFYSVLVVLSIRAARSDDLSVRSVGAGGLALCVISLAGYGPALIAQEAAAASFWLGCLAVLAAPGSASRLRTAYRPTVRRWGYASIT